MDRTLTVSDFNVAAWTQGDYVRAYDRTEVDAAESVLLERHRERLGGTVLELGCGAGRLTRELARMGGHVTALDVSERMVAACARNVPAAHPEVGDLRDLSRYPDGAFTAIVAGDNVIDVLDDDDRRASLTGWARVLAPGGVLLFSSHNYAHIPHIGPEPDLLRRAYHGRHFARRARNRRFARAYERDAGEYAIYNDSAHDHRLAHYYIGRDAQASQLAEAGFTLVDCLDQGGESVGPGESAEHSSSLLYAARRT